jgi:ABC-2 type transport system permease protein
MALLFAIVIMASMGLAALFIAHVPIATNRLAGVAIINVAGALPFCAIGLFIGTIVKGTAAPGFTNLVYLPMIYLSGLFFPLPKSLATIAPIWPAYHLNQLALGAAGVLSSSAPGTHLAVLAGVTALFTWLALRRLARAS